MNYSDLKAVIIDLIEKKGKITFEEFMDLALYHPEHGYYTYKNERIGKRGDFYTSSDVHPVFGELIARQLEQMWRLLESGNFTVVEMGAGKGWLCYDIISFIKDKFPDFFEKLDYKIVEISKDFVKKQSGILKEFEDKIKWESFSSDGFTFEPVNGCFLSNEFIDSLPVHQVIVENGCLREIYVETNNGEFFEIIDELSIPKLKDYFKELNVNLNEGQKAEVNLKALDWMRNVSSFLKRGFVITIDYGYLAEDLYSENRARGTLMCYYKHTTSENPFSRLGNQDITSHVNFSALMQTGKESGLTTTGYTKQSHFLIALNILDKMKESHGNIGRFLTMKNLILPGGMGDIFKVLIQHKGVDNPGLGGLRSITEHELATEIECLEGDE
ncbi:MAG: class I SAM-dependent methyltransferase [Candidatus Scalinduaceae bacterium]